MESAQGGKKKRLSPSSVSQIQILSALAPETSPLTNEPRRLQINEIAEISGQKLVTPFPEGDFTSKIWEITTQGVQTLRHISTAIAA